MHTFRSMMALAVTTLIVSGAGTEAAAQTEEIEPRVIAQTGHTLIGFSGSLSRFFSSEELMAGSFTMQVDGQRFISRRIAIRFGAVGTGAFGASGSDDDSDASTSSAPALEALAGGLYYFTPESIWSFYLGGEYRARITERIAGDRGSINGLLGLQGALSSRAAFFLEAGYGFRIRRGDEGELLTRIVGLAGVRFRF